VSEITLGKFELSKKKAGAYVVLQLDAREVDSSDALGNMRFFRGGESMIVVTKERAKDLKNEIVYEVVLREVEK
jgi:hypothetical protein